MDITVRIIAHRGGVTGTPENTLAAFKRALDIGVDCIELDIQVTSDDVPVVIHDATVDRTTNGAGSVASFTLAQLKEFDAGDGEQVPALREVFELVGDQIPFILEFKTTAAVLPSVALFKEHPEVRWTGLSSLPDALETLRAELPEADLAVGTLGSKEGALRFADMVEASGYPVTKAYLDRHRQAAMNFSIEDVFLRATALGAKKLAVYWEALNEDLVNAMHNRGFEIGAWTVNNVADAVHLQSIGVDTLTTDDPATMMQFSENPRVPQAV